MKINVNRPSGKYNPTYTKGFRTNIRDIENPVENDIKMHKLDSDNEIKYSTTKWYKFSNKFEDVVLNGQPWINPDETETLHLSDMLIYPGCVFYTTVSHEQFNASLQLVEGAPCPMYALDPANKIRISNTDESEINVNNFYDKTTSIDLTEFPLILLAPDKSIATESNFLSFIDNFKPESMTWQEAATEAIAFANDRANFSFTEFGTVSKTNGPDGVDREFASGHIYQQRDEAKFYTFKPVDDGTSRPEADAIDRLVSAHDVSALVNTSNPEITEPVDTTWTEFVYTAATDFECDGSESWYDGYTYAFNADEQVDFYRYLGLNKSELDALADEKGTDGIVNVSHLVYMYSDSEYTYGVKLTGSDPSVYDFLEPEVGVEYRMTDATLSYSKRLGLIFPHLQPWRVAYEKYQEHLLWVESKLESTGAAGTFSPCEVTRSSTSPWYQITGTGTYKTASASIDLSPNDKPELYRYYEYLLPFAFTLYTKYSKSELKELYRNSDTYGLGYMKIDDSMCNRYMYDSYEPYDTSVMVYMKDYPESPYNIGYLIMTDDLFIPFGSRFLEAFKPDKIAECVADIVEQIRNGGGSFFTITTSKFDNVDNSSSSSRIPTIDVWKRCIESETKLNFIKTNAVFNYDEDVNVPVAHFYTPLTKEKFADVCDHVGPYDENWVNCSEFFFVYSGNDTYTGPEIFRPGKHLDKNEDGDPTIINTGGSGESSYFTLYYNKLTGKFINVGQEYFLDIKRIVESQGRTLDDIAVDLQDSGFKVWDNVFDCYDSFAERTAYSYDESEKIDVYTKITEDVRTSADWSNGGLKYLGKSFEPAEDEYITDLNDKGIKPWVEINDTRKNTGAGHDVDIELVSENVYGISTYIPAYSEENLAKITSATEMTYRDFMKKLCVVDNAQPFAAFVTPQIMGHHNYLQGHHDATSSPEYIKIDIKGMAYDLDRKMFAGRKLYIEFPQGDVTTTVTKMRIPATSMEHGYEFFYDAEAVVTRIPIEIPEDNDSNEIYFDTSVYGFAMFLNGAASDDVIKNDEIRIQLVNEDEETGCNRFVKEYVVKALPDIRVWTSSTKYTVFENHDDSVMTHEVPDVYTFDADNVEHASIDISFDTVKYTDDWERGEVESKYVIIGLCMLRIAYINKLGITNRYYSSNDILELLTITDENGIDITSMFDPIEDYNGNASYLTGICSKVPMMVNRATRFNIRFNDYANVCDEYREIMKESSASELPIYLSPCTNGTAVLTCDQMKIISDAFMAKHNYTSFTVIDSEYGVKRTWKLSNPLDETYGRFAIDNG